MPTSPVTWHQDAELTVAYPPQPWHLGGRLSLTLWRVPTAALPETFTAAVPSGARPLATRGNTLVGTAFVRYAAGGVLSYDELLAAIPVRDGRRVAIALFARGGNDRPRTIAEAARSIYDGFLATFRRPLDGLVIGGR